ncbi:MAG TPA: tetratricopeptide repeat protein [Spirochaetota bacterium]|nr:tetratricopeptide repeat protein [Spirochaetota bacterium]
MNTRLSILLIAIACALPLTAQTVDELNRQGVDLAEKGEDIKAEDTFRKAAAIQDKRSAKAFHNRGWVMELQGNVNVALENYREAIRRDPDLYDSYERIGYWSYRMGRYADAIAMGEKVLKLDPGNQDVKKWLIDAYAKRTEQGGPEADPTLLGKPSPTAVNVPPRPIKDEKAAQSPSEEKKEPFKPKMTASFDLTVPVGYYYKDKDVKYVRKGTMQLNVPYTVDCLLTPIPDSKTHFSFNTGKPYLGAGMPNVVAQYERVDAVFALGPFGLGMGLLISHYRDDFNYGKKTTLIDVKLGGTVEYADNDTVFSFVAYPKFIPLFSDDKHSTGKTFDACFIEMKYRYLVDEVMSYYSRLTFGDYYFYDHDIPYSNYWGFYDVAVGMTLGSKGALFGKDIDVTVEMGKRVYLQALAKENPYLTANGSGFFGFDRKKSGGKRFSGYHGTSNIFSVAGGEDINDHVSLYQKVMVEFVDRHSDHHEFALTLGVRGKY